MTGVLGKDMLVFIHDGADPGALVEVPHQGDATYNPGKTAQNSIQKNSKLPYHTDEGASVTFTIKKERPAHAIHTRLRTLTGTSQQTQCEYRDKNAGGESYSGPVTVTVGEETTGTGGLLEQQVVLSFAVDPVVGTTP
jgi:hypothetical protein